ncbi:aspartate/glutamate racemase family protein [Pigmentiphaga soli]|uniref:Aspartate/glutamate racemase family protein n=1 Tax=Pigmentiphaga soli TaxID=1007095 RepID=A0ABP8GT92_9BURK
MPHGEPRVILVVPSNNTTMEPEIRAYCPAIAELAVARVPRPPRPLQVDDLPQYRESTIGAVRPLIGDGAALVIYGCTSAGFLAGPAGDAAFVETLSDLVGAPTVSTSTAILAALAEAGIDRVDVVSPYLDWKNDMLRAFLSGSGIRVDRLQSFGAQNPTELGRITSEQVLQKCLDTASPDGRALFIACSQLPTRDIIPVLAQRLDRPVWSSVKAAGWQAMQWLLAGAGSAARGTQAASPH